MRLREIMSTRVQTIAPTESAETAWERMSAHRIHHLVVVSENDLGIISDTDLGGIRGETLRQGRTVADLMSPAHVKAEPETTIRQAANLLRGRSIGCLPVFEGAKLVGIITTTDLLGLIGR